MSFLSDAGDLFYRRFEPPARSHDGPRLVIPRTKPETKTGYLPHPLAVSKSDLQAYVAQLDPPFSSLQEDVSDTIVGKIVKGIGSTSAEKKILVAMTNFSSRWKVVKSEIEATGIGWTAEMKKLWTKCEEMEFEYRGLRKQWIDLGYTPSSAAPPEKKDISEPPGILDKVGTLGKITIPATVLVIVGGVIAYLVIRK